MGFVVTEAPPLSAATVGCIILTAIILILLCVIAYMLDSRHCGACRGIDKRLGSGFCSWCGRSW